MWKFMWCMCKHSSRYRIFMKKDTGFSCDVATQGSHRKRVHLQRTYACLSRTWLIHEDYYVQLYMTHSWGLLRERVYDSFMRTITWACLGHPNSPHEWVIRFSVVHDSFMRTITWTCLGHPNSPHEWVIRFSVVHDSFMSTTRSRSVSRSYMNHLWG